MTLEEQAAAVWDVLADVTDGNATLALQVLSACIVKVVLQGTTQRDIGKLEYLDTVVVPALRGLLREGVEKLEAETGGDLSD